MSSPDYEETFPPGRQVKKAVLVEPFDKVDWDNHEEWYRKRFQYLVDQKLAHLMDKVMACRRRFVGDVLAIQQAEIKKITPEQKKHLVSYYQSLNEHGWVSANIYHISTIMSHTKCGIRNEYHFNLDHHWCLLCKNRHIVLLVWHERKRQWFCMCPYEHI